ncbi:MAG: MnhB domain-containing protein [Acidimicrobiia bacterium]|nr:MnhB domain-containing protein [Acidimicrobiia bacterium]
MNPRPSPVLDALLPGVVRATLVLSLYLLFAGHNAPGGGFVGGLVGSVAFVLVYAARGGGAMRRAARFRPTTYLGAGIVVAGVTGTIPMLVGEAFLTGAKTTLDLPLIGTVQPTSALAFDIGVYLVVVGLVLAVLAAFPEEGPS